MIESLRCTNCGAPLPAATSDRDEVVCRSCGAAHALAPELGTGLRAHRRAVGAVRDDARASRRRAAGAVLARSFTPGWAAGFVASWCGAGACLLGGTPLATALSVLLFAAPFVALAVVARARTERFEGEAEASRAREDALPLRCPTCGGQNGAVPDEPVLGCAYCGAALAADEASRLELLARARASARSDEHRARVEAWRTAAARGREPSSELAPYWVLGGLAALWVLGALAVDARALLGEGSAPASSLVVTNLVAVAALLGLGGALAVRSARLRRWSEGVALLGSAEAELAAHVRWLEQHWRGEFADELLVAGRGYAFVASSAAAPAWAVSLAPWSARASAPVRHVRVLVPGAPGAHLERCAARLRPLGYACVVGSGGLVATLAPERLEDLARQPSALAALRAALDER